MTKKLYRDTSNQKIGGVCAGIADYFELDPTIIRLIAVALFFVTGNGGLIVLIYIVMMVILPTKQTNKSIASEIKSQSFDETIEEFVDETVKAADSSRGRDLGTFFGIGLVLIGLYYLLRMMIPTIDNLDSMLISLLLMISGGYLIFKQGKR